MTIDALNCAEKDFNEINRVMKENPFPDGSNASSIVVRTRKIVSLTSESIANAKNNLSIVSNNWEILYDVTNSLIDLIEGFPAEQDRVKNLAAIEQMLVLFTQTLPGSGVSALQMLSVLEMLSSKMKPIVTVYRRFGDLVNGWLVQPTFF